MQTLEYLAFIPLLMYGLGLADLLSQWKRLFDPEDWYLPYTVFTVILTEIAVYNVFIYFNLLVQLPGQSYFTYLSYLLPPFLFILTTSAFTPEKEAKTNEHFIKRMPIFFTTLAMLILSHFIFQYGESIYVHIGRLLIVVILIIVGFIRKIWPVYIIAFIWLISFLFRGNVGSGTTPIDDPKTDQSSNGDMFFRNKEYLNQQNTSNQYYKNICVKEGDAGYVNTIQGDFTGGIILKLGGS